VGGGENPGKKNIKHGGKIPSSKIRGQNPYSIKI